LAAIAGVFGRSENSHEIVEHLLLALRHRGSNVRIEDGNGKRGSWAVGCASGDDVESHFSENSQGTFAVDGSLFQRRNPARFALGHAESVGIPGGVRRLMSEPGEYAVLAHVHRKLLAFRDPNGMKPLYYAKGRRFVAFASERKALWRIGLIGVKRSLPGNLYTVNDRGETRTELVTFRHSSESHMSYEQATLHLARLLKTSIQRVTKNIDRVAIAFSGGLDSAVTAALARSCCEVELVSVGLSGSTELSTVEKYANEMGLPVRTESFEQDSLEEYVRRIVWLIEEPSLMKVGVAIPLHWTAALAARRGFKVMLCGQGSDELYGGYRKYARILATDGRRALVNALRRSVLEASQVNYERDEQATAPLGVELRTPFTDLDVIRFSLSIPSEYKVKTGDDTIRKWVLRSAAEQLGLPRDIVWRRKKAIQHGTGVENAIRKLARAQNLDPEAYLASIHSEVRDLEAMP
jgi:asparagine synthase (glutamine-hydrolysing)